MDKRRKPLTAYEQLELREKLDALIAEHPEYSVPQMLRQARTLLRLTLEEMAQLAGITVLTLKRIEAGTSSPSLRTVERLLRPLGLKLAIVKRSPTVLLRQVLPDDLNHAVGSRTRWEKP